ncbi:phage integrase SAM-like domain-containing protein [uncultured Spirosoma sp.]|uniref:phage integrase SAM-like domain-containing protein n=1 Tax=uncultured Spirosoma sp. TaxID=278208 RepID=UPI002590B70B|nr:phage integrase SAM-like domain-containing protein [uncultured Spirosoma sp.]
MSQLYCRIHVSGVQLDIGSTGLTINNEHWVGGRITNDDPQAHFKNERLSIIHDQLLAIYNDQLRSRKPITAGSIKRAYLGQAGCLSLPMVFDLYMRDSATDPERKLTTSTLTVYDNVRKKLIDFLANEKALDLAASEFDVSWAKRYRRWMASLPQPDGKVGYAESYIIKQTQTIKNVLIWAKLHKHIDSNPLDGLKLKGAEFGDSVYITEEQFQTLRKHHFVSRVLQETADVLAILYRSGFHYGDLLDMVAQHKTAVRQGLDGKLWMMKKCPYPVR